MKIHELFESDVTRDIPPVVYFHEQSPEKLQAEVSEYIITGGWKPDHPNHQRVRRGIHEHYVKLLRRISDLLETSGGPELPASWISGFYGSGKSSFAKLLGLSLDGAKLPDGRPLADAWLARDRSQKAADLRQAWTALTAKIDPIAVVFDIGGVSRGNEHIHSAVVRQVQTRLDYCPTSPLVANYELKLERDGHYQEFLAIAERTLGEPWSRLRTTHMAEDHFSAVLHAQFPTLFQDPMHWITVRDGDSPDRLSAEDAARAIADMLQHRTDGEKTLFIVVDEVSQYIFQDDSRMLALQSLVSALGQRLRGKAWLLATGQQKLDDQNDANVLNKMKDRFPEGLRVHLDATSIRDVVHRRLLQKREDALPTLRALYAQHRSNLQLFAYGCETITEEDFVEVYPLLPRHIDLILRITTALRSRSSRAQGDHHAIRGLLQMLGELFRTQQESLTHAEVGALITLDQIYEIQGSALDVDTQNTMARIFEYCAATSDHLAIRCAKAVALLEMLQDDLGSDAGVEATDSRMVARCLYANVAEGDNEPAIREALTRLRGEGLLGYSEKTGYKIQSSAGQDWERERGDISVSYEDRAELVKETLAILVADTGRPELFGRKFPWQGLFSTETTHKRDKFIGAREDSPMVVDFRFVSESANDVEGWINRSAESTLENQLLWVAGSYQPVMDAARRIGQSKRMIGRHAGHRASLSGPRQRLLNEEETRLGTLQDEFKKVVADAFMAGTMYFRGSDTKPASYGGGFIAALGRAGTARLPTIYGHYVPTTVTNGELDQLVKLDLAGAATKFLDGELGILAMDDTRLVAKCDGAVPTRVRELVRREHGISGQSVLRHFAQPPYGHTANLVKACVAGLLRAREVRVQLRDGSQVSSIADPGVNDLFRLDRDFKVAEIFPAEEERVGPKERAKLVHTFKTVFGVDVEPEPEAIADHLPRLLLPKVEALTDVERRLNRLPDPFPTPEPMLKLRKAIADCLRDRKVDPMLQAAIKHRETLQTAVGLLNRYQSELDDGSIETLRRVHSLAHVQLAQLIEAGELGPELQDAERRLGEQLGSPSPWLGIDAVEPEAEQIRQAYQAVRSRMLGEQEVLAEQTRDRIKRLDGFNKLDADERNSLLRLVGAALRETSEAETTPPLRGLLDGLEPRLDSAYDQAGERLAELLAKRGEQVTITVDIDVRGRVITSAADVDALLDEIRTRLLAQLDAQSGKTRLRLK